MWYIGMHMAQIKGKYLWKFSGPTKRKIAPTGQNDTSPRSIDYFPE
jgi:hypothetical protein